MFFLTLLLVSSLWLLGVFIKFKFGINSKKSLSPRKHPPGPWGFPIFGYMPFFAFNPLNQLQKLASDYGDICTIYLGRYRVVMLNSHNAIREAFKEDSLSGRPALKMLEVRNGGDHLGLVCSEGKHWNEQRKFTLRHLKDLGFGKRSMEGLVLEEVDDLVSVLRCNIGSPIDLKSKFNLAVLNALWRIISGQRYKHDDIRLQNILQKTSADLSDTQYTGPLLFLPWLVKVAPRLTRWNEFSTSIKSVHKFLNEIISKHKEEFHDDRKGKEMNDFIDYYIAEIEKTSDRNSSFYKEKGEHSLLVVLLDLLMAGADTTSVTLSWAFLYMILNEKVQRNVQQEIDLVIGNSSPTLEHRKVMPYTEATIMEVLRKSSLVPMGLFHSAVHDTQLLGYDIPKGTVIMANLYNLNYHKSYWRNPEVFQPERFLNESGCAVNKSDALIPFSTGKRACPGENLAKDQIFLFLVGLLQKFSFVADSSCPKPTDIPNNGVILSPKPYSVLIRNRIVGAI